MRCALPSRTARGVCLIETLVCAAEYVGRPRQQPIKRTLSPTHQLRHVVEDNEEVSARER